MWTLLLVIRIVGSGIDVLLRKDPTLNAHYCWKARSSRAAHRPFYGYGRHITAVEV